MIKQKSGEKLVDEREDDIQNKLPEQLPEPIDGQIGFEELLVPYETEDDGLPVYIPPITGQISFDEYSNDVFLPDSFLKELCEKAVDEGLRAGPENDENTKRTLKQEHNKKQPVITQENDKKAKITQNTPLNGKPPLRAAPRSLANEAISALRTKGKQAGKFYKTETKKQEKNMSEFEDENEEHKINDGPDGAGDLSREELDEEMLSEDEEAAARKNKDVDEQEELEAEEVEIEQADSEEDAAPATEEKTADGGSGEDIVDGMYYKSIDVVLHESMIPYSEHVILDRALPRVEDGLKPVQRRILYSMLELGVTPDKPHRKSARIVGDCMGKYHPHGDSSVYDAMVRMAQPYNTNGLLIDGHGNFGSIDGDSAAAMRYTEARLAPLAMELLRDLEKDTVKWNFNFDDTLKEPDVLPGRFPNLLVNGSTGIAVGLATNIPPHNLAETIDGVCAYIDNPGIKLKEMLKIIKGPDFPTGGIILAESEIEQAYRTGKGKIILRARMHIETDGAEKRNIVITEIPFQTNKAAILQRIAALREEGKGVIAGVADIRDESDRKGIRAVIKVKKDADTKAICDYLFKYTNLQTTFGINMVAIAGGKPKQMSLLEIIGYYVNYQREIIYRRSKFELEEAKEREYILSGLLIAIKNIDAVIKIIKTSPNTTTAKQRLKEKFVLSERQAQAILDMRLARLTALEVNKLEEEIRQLKELIKKLTAIVGSKKLQFELVKTEMQAIKKQFKTERKSLFAKNEEHLHIPSDTDKPETKEVVLAVNALGNIKSITKKQFNVSQREFKENSALPEAHEILVETDTDRTAFVFTDLGNCYKVSAADIPESRFKDKGVPLKTVAPEALADEKPVGIICAGAELPQGNLIFLTKCGMIKKTEFKEYNLLKNAFQAIKLKEDDRVLEVREEVKDATILFVTKNGMVLNALTDDVPLQGRISGGVKGINLGAGDICVLASQTDGEGEAVLLTDNGLAKRVLISGIEPMARYRKGVKIITFAGGKSIVLAAIVKNPYYIVGEDKSNNLLGKFTDKISIESRTGKGKPIDKKVTQLIKGYKYLIE